MTAPALFDRALARKRLQRALFGSFAPYLFDRAAHELAERLQAIQRPFAQALDLGAPFAGLRERIAAPGRRIVRMAPVFESAAPGDCVGDEECSPFAPQSFDLVISLLALQHVNDAPGVFVQAARLLRPDGLLIGALAGGSTLRELRQSLMQAESEISGGASPRVFPFADVRELGALLQRAGLTLPVADSEILTVRFDSMFALLHDLRAFGATNVLCERSKKPTPSALFLRAAQIYAERFSDSDGRIRATFEWIWFAGWAPHASQRKPLAPGSASHRLSDVLGDASSGKSG